MTEASERRTPFLELRCGAELRSVRVLTELLDVALRELGLEEDLRHDVTLAVAELVTNVCQHEYRGGEGAVGVRLEAHAGRLEVVVDSQGSPFDLEAALRRTAANDPLADLRSGGLGLALIATLFEEFRAEHEEGRGNRITLRRPLV